MNTRILLMLMAFLGLCVSVPRAHAVEPTYYWYEVTFVVGNTTTTLVGRAKSDPNEFSALLTKSDPIFLDSLRVLSAKKGVWEARKNRTSIYIMPRVIGFFHPLEKDPRGSEAG